MGATAKILKLIIRNDAMKAEYVFARILTEHSAC